MNKKVLILSTSLMKRSAVLLSSLLMAFFLVACGAQGSGQKAHDVPGISAVSNPLQEISQAETSLSQTGEEKDVKSIQVTAGNKTFTATLANNAGAAAFVELFKNEPLVINMNDYSGFEKVGSLGVNLPASNSSITATEGDIILYHGNQICVFYGSNAWSYTRLAKIDDLAGWEEALGSGDVAITFSLK